MSDNPDDLKPATPSILEKCALCGEDILPEDTVLGLDGVCYHEECWDEFHEGSITKGRRLTLSADQR